MQLKLTFNIKPVPHQSVRIGRNNIAYKPKKIINYQVAIRALAIAQLPKGFEMIPAGTEITIQRLSYQFEYLKSTPKKRRTGKVALRGRVSKVGKSALLVVSKSENKTIENKENKNQSLENSILEKIK